MTLKDGSMIMPCKFHQGEKVYETASFDRRRRVQLTLNHFSVNRCRETMAEALLRFETVLCRTRTSPHNIAATDVPGRTFMDMFFYYNKLANKG